MIVAPSLISADFSNLAGEVRSLEAAGITWLHLDVMDGCFVPNITFGPQLIHSVRSCCGLFFDVHLMVENPGRLLPEFRAAGADLLVVHVEADRHLNRTLSQIHRLGCRAGLALNPGTDVSAVNWLANDIDLLLIMGVNPGFSGQQFIPRTVEKVRAARRLLDELGSRAAIQVDGGVCPDNLSPLLEAGASVLVSGSAFFRERPYSASLKEFRKIAAAVPVPQSGDVHLWKHEKKDMEC